MVGLISYTCDKCGGILNIDCDQENLGCPFCGRQIDYAEYHRQDFLSQAELNLKQKEIINQPDAPSVVVFADYVIRSDRLAVKHPFFAVLAVTYNANIA